MQSYAAMSLPLILLSLLLLGHPCRAWDVATRAERLWGCKKALPYAVRSLKTSKLISFGHLGSTNVDREHIHSHEAFVLCFHELTWTEPLEQRGEWLYPIPINPPKVDGVARWVVSLCNPARNSCMRWHKGGDVGQEDHIDFEEKAQLYVLEGDMGVGKKGKRAVVAFRAQKNNLFMANENDNCRATKNHIGPWERYELVPLDREYSKWPTNKDDVCFDGDKTWSVPCEQPAKLFGGRQ